MRCIKILDCTLRDGGYVNDWNFGLGTIENVISRLNKAGIDIVEVGFLDERRKYDENRSIFPNTDSIKPVFKNLVVQGAMILAMIDFGTCGIEKLSDRKDSVIDGIRVIFKKRDYHEALNFCAEVKQKGYKIFLQPVSVTDYTDVEMTTLLKEANEISPFGIYIVDTYGLMHKKEVMHYFDLMNKRLSEEIAIGYHSHNNFQLAYANCTELMAVESCRELMVDGSLHGMGKSAGNACTELLAMHLNENYGGKYDIDQLLEAIDVDIMKEYAKQYWGYSLKHFIAASNDCHPDYVSNLMCKKTLAVKSISEIIAKIAPGNKLKFNRDIMEELYQEYQNNVIDDSSAYTGMGAELNNKNILIIAPGKTIELNAEEIRTFIREKNPVIMTINFINDDYKPDYVFMGNAKRYSQFFNKIYRNDLDVKVVCTSNVSESNRKIDYKFNFGSLVNENEIIRDNPVLMLLKILVKMKCPKVCIAGFDGYVADDSQNYPGEYIQFLFCDDNVVLRNEAVKKALALIGKDIRLEFLTPSRYL
ncbi:MAG: aldolase catalytic domain-containing protein [Desulfobacterales bacterium]|nr:aldolase catalytic domain-containing protein [Desulfobacterales bacterium]